MPRFQVYVSFSSRSRGPAESAHRYVSEAEPAVAADARVSEAKTYAGYMGTIASEFRVSADDKDKAVEIGHDVFRAALLKAGAPIDRPDWRISVGAKLIDEETGWPVQPAASINVVLRQLQVSVGWDDLQALQRRLEHIQENVGLRANLGQPHGHRRDVYIRGLQAVALHFALEDWAVDLHADEAMQQGLGDLRRGLFEYHRDLDPTTLAQVMDSLSDGLAGDE